MRSPLRASLGAKKGPSVRVIFCFMWLRPHCGWLVGGGGEDEVPSPGHSWHRVGPQCACDFLFDVAAFSWRVVRWWRRGG